MDGVFTHVAFIGLEDMGRAMASRLLNEGIKLYVYSRQEENGRHMLEKGAYVLNVPSDAFEQAPVVMSLVYEDEMLKLLSREILKNAKPGCIHISMSSTSPDLIRELEKQHEEKGVKLVSAPFYGRPAEAASGKLWFTLAGDREAKARVEPLLHFIGQKVHDFGDHPEIANMVKLTGNFYAMCTIEMLAEAIAIVEKNGIDPVKVHDFFVQTFGSHPIFVGYGKLLLERKFTSPGIKLAFGLRDMNIINSISKGLNLPFRDVLIERFKEGMEKNRGDLDWSAISLSVLEEFSKHP